MRQRIKNLATDLKTDCAKRHRVFLNQHFWGIGFGAKSADITAFSGRFSFPNLSLKNEFGKQNMFLGRFLGNFQADLGSAESQKEGFLCEKRTSKEGQRNG